MAYQEHRGRHSFPKSVSFAISGIAASFREKHIRVHYFISALVIAGGIFFRLTITEWILALSCIAGVIALEMVNTAIERTVDLVTGEYHPLARQAKDIAAGAVLIYSIYSVVVGFILFGPKLLSLFH